MKTNFTLLGMATLFLLLCGSVNATDYTLSSSPQSITTPGTHTITGSGSGRIDINNSVANAVYEITLDNMSLIATETGWASAIACNNNSTGTMTVKFNIKGTNITKGHNHGGIKSGAGIVDVIFTTTTSGTLTCDAWHSENFAFQKETGTTFTPSIDPTNILCTATLEGVEVPVATALTQAFTKKPLVLSLEKNIKHDLSTKSGEFDITEPGAYTITGAGNYGFGIKPTVDNAVFNITLDNMTLTAAQWGSAIFIENKELNYTMTINFIVKGTNASTGGNHGGIQVQKGTANIMFTTKSLGSLKLDATYSENFAFTNHYNGIVQEGFLNATIDPNLDPTIVCSAKLEGNNVTNTVALSDAFTKKPLELTFAKTTTATHPEAINSTLILKSINNTIQIEGLKMGENYSIYDMMGKSIVNAKAKNAIESVSLSKGIYIIRTSNETLKFAF